jgi:hypothetical protein
MAKVTLLLREATFTVASEPLGRARGLFAAGGLPSRSRFQSRVSVSIFRPFLIAVKGNDIQITSENVSGLSQLDEEFGFLSLSMNLSAFRNSPSFKDSADAEARG